jgi:hypothetical protein
LPDFDSFERIFKSAISGEISFDNGAAQIHALDEINKVKVVKGKNTGELKEFLIRANKMLIGFFPKGANFSSNNNNRDGKDLYEELSGTQIELKSGGAMTDANSGLAIVSWTIGDDSEEISRIMKAGMAERRVLAKAKNNVSEINRSKAKTMDDLAQLFQNRISIGFAPETLSHFFRCVAVGLTKSGEILSTYQSGAKIKVPLLLKADWDKGLVLYEKAFLPDEKIIIEKIERTQKRFQLVAKGKVSETSAKLYATYRNSWKHPDGSKVHASNWVESPSFQVWIGKPQRDKGIK